MTEEEARAIFILAGMKIIRVYQLPNQYWPKAYEDLRAKSPWWLLQTNLGLFRIGWRKRVIHIDWEATPHRFIVTEDEVTKNEEMVHAYGYAKAVEYVTTWRRKVDVPAEEVNNER